MQCLAAILVMAGVYISQRRPVPVAKKEYHSP
jgi:hypothetical protein